MKIPDTIKKLDSLVPRKIDRALKGIYYYRLLKSYDFSQRPDMDIIRLLVKPGNTVVDLGASIGIYAPLLSSLTGSSGRVICFEPIPSTFEILESTIHKFKLSNTFALNYAVSDSESIRTMIIPQKEKGLDDFYCAKITDNDSKSDKALKIQTRTLDSLSKEFDWKIDFIKCAVIEHELPCVQGAEEINNKYKPAWLIDMHTNPDHEGSPAEALFYILLKKNYSAWFFNGKKMIRRKKGQIFKNYFFLQDEHLETLRLKSPEIFE